ncbi:MAG: tRNA (adenosine(37)-N6)-threonylcarbamoyltransferase complex dimerization subunit type 1 TsaB [Candidatus Dasytiphilus stammeri]
MKSRINKIMRILAIDTSTKVCSVALFNKGEIRSVVRSSSKKPAEIVLSMIQNLLSESEIYLNQLNALAYNRGPGSFTGLRIGISIAQGIGLGLDLPLIGISSLAVLAENAWHLTRIKRVLVALNAYMGQIYWAEYQRINLSNSCWKGVETETILNPLEVKSKISNLNGIWCVAGNGWYTYQYLKDLKKVYVSTPVSIPIANNILPLAIVEYKEGKIFSADCSSVEPYYIRNDLLWKKLPGRT